MGAFSLYVQLSDGEPSRSVEEILGPYIETYDSVSYEQTAGDGSGSVTETGLDIGDIDAFAAILEELKETPDVESISLWGPGSQRYPVQVYHHALRSLSDPDRYQFHAIDDRVTLLICDTPAALRQAKDEIGPAGLVKGGEAKF